MRRTGEQIAGVVFHLAILLAVAVPDAVATEVACSGSAIEAMPGTAWALHHQATFLPDLAWDGRIENLKGWAYHGQIDKAYGVFVLPEISSQDEKMGWLLKAVRLFSGVGMEDHRLRSAQLFFWPCEFGRSALHRFVQNKSAWERLEEEFLPLSPLRSQQKQVYTAGNAFYTAPAYGHPLGLSEVCLSFPQSAAQAIAIRVDASDHIYNNSVINEIQVFGQPAHDLEIKHHEYLHHRETADREYGGSIDETVHKACQAGLSSEELLRNLSSGHWSPIHAAADDAVEDVLRNQGCREHRSWIPEGIPAPSPSEDDACKWLAGTRILFIGDSRIRQLVIAFLLLLEPEAIRRRVSRC